DEESDPIKCVINIHDTGIGIPENAKDRMFQAFTQAESSTARQFGGTGLGLSISKRLIELMNGNINFESQYGKGKTFHLDLFFKKGSQKNPIEQFINQSEIFKKHVPIKL